MARGYAPQLQLRRRGRRRIESQTSCFQLMSMRMAGKPLDWMWVGGQLLVVALAAGGVRQWRSNIAAAARLLLLHALPSVHCGPGSQSANVLVHGAGKTFQPLEAAPAAVARASGGTSTLWLQTRGSKFVRFQELKLQERALEVRACTRRLSQRPLQKAACNRRPGVWLILPNTLCARQGSTKAAPVCSWRLGSGSTCRAPCMREVSTTAAHVCRRTACTKGRPGCLLAEAEAALWALRARVQMQMLRGAALCN